MPIATIEGLEASGVFAWKFPFEALFTPNSVWSVWIPGDLTF